MHNVCHNQYSPYCWSRFAGRARLALFSLRSRKAGRSLVTNNKISRLRPIVRGRTTDPQKTRQLLHAFLLIKTPSSWTEFKTRRLRVWAAGLYSSEIRHVPAKYGHLSNDGRLLQSVIYILAESRPEQNITTSPTVDPRDSQVLVTWPVTAAANC